MSWLSRTNLQESSGSPAESKLQRTSPVLGWTRLFSRKRYWFRNFANFLSLVFLDSFVCSFQLI
jgi:hypothetical protein